MLRFTPDPRQQEEAVIKPLTAIPDCIEVKSFHPLFIAMMEVSSYEDPKTASQDFKRNHAVPAT